MNWRLVSWQTATGDLCCYCIIIQSNNYIMLYRVKGQTSVVADEIEVTSPKVKTARNQKEKSEKKEKKNRRSSTFVTSLSMNLQPISMESDEQVD